MKSSPLHAVFLVASAAALLLPIAAKAALPVYRIGHSDLVPIYQTQPDRLELKIRFDPDLTYEDGSPVQQIVDASSVAIRIGDPAILRDEADPNVFFDIDRTGPQWDFIGVEVDEFFYSLPQSSTTGFPFMGIASDTLNPAAQWSSGLTYTLREVQVAPEIDGVTGEVSLWQQNSIGDPQNVYFVSSDGVDSEEDYFVDSIGGHDHYNWSFSLPGMYKLQIGVNAIHSTAGELDATTTLTFLVGDAATQTETTTQPGDFNSDGVVDLADYTVWRNNLGATEDGTVLGGNGNGGLVDTTDYQDWKNLFGTDYAAGNSLAAQAIPEPSSLLSLIVGSVFLLAATRRTWRCV